MKLVRRSRYVMRSFSPSFDSHCASSLAGFMSSRSRGRQPRNTAESCKAVRLRSIAIRAVRFCQAKACDKSHETTARRCRLCRQHTHVTSHKTYVTSFLLLDSCAESLDAYKELRRLRSKTSSSETSTSIVMYCLRSHCLRS